MTTRSLHASDSPSNSRASQLKFHEVHQKAPLSPALSLSRPSARAALASSLNRPGRKTDRSRGREPLVQTAYTLKPQWGFGSVGSAVQTSFPRFDFSTFRFFFVLFFLV